MAEHKNIGQWLLEKGVLSQEQLNLALREQSVSNQRMGDILVNMGLVKEEDIVTLLSEQMGLAYIDLSTYQVEPEVLRTIDEKTAHRFQVIPLFQVDRLLTVAMVDPLNLQAIDELTRLTKREIQPVFGTKTGVKEALQRYYGKASALEDAIEAFKDKGGTDSKSSKKTSEDIATAETADDAPAIKMVNLILTQAVRDGASDIHVEPGENSLSIRCRIDGILTSLAPPPFSLQGAILSRIKVLANLDIAEKRLPQDGRVQITVESRSIDLRVSTFPTIYGENVVLRILDKSSGILTLDRLGMRSEFLKKIKELITLPNGIVLVTGPTGSGKTTTLYSFLNEINHEDKNIMTLEDPVEYRIHGIRQAHVDVKAGLTFQTGLRSILRQDPDVIMIGEIRDLQTAEIAIQAALTGHLVFSTAHTNDAPSTIARLIDMGIEPFLVSSSIVGILAQRLVRKLCENCKKPYTPTPAILEKWGLSPGNHTFFDPVGCDKCRKTGYKGRISVYELLVPNTSIKQMVNEKRSAGEIEQEAKKHGFEPLRIDGIHKVIAGQTSLTEVLRVS